MNRPKLIVLKCRCGCGQWGAFRFRPQFNEGGYATSLGMYRDTWRDAVTAAVRWSRKVSS